MSFVRLLLVTCMLGAALPARAAAAEDDGWEAFGHALTLVQTLVGIAARSDDPQANLKGIDDVLAGRNEDANRAIAGLLNDATSDMPSEYRDKVAAIGRDLTVAARRDLAKAPADAVSPDRALQARKDLNAMGLSYYDAKQFLDAVKRDDALAVELYIVGRGVNLSARDADGRSALDIARAQKNARIADLLARNLPAAR
jgi:hypothetical protein